MKTVFKGLSIILFTLGFAGHSYAANGYAGASIGQANVDMCDDVAALGGTACDDKDTGFKIFGGYDFNETFAIEVGYADLGEVSANAGATKITAELNGFYVDAKATIPVNESFGIFGKLGLVRWEAEVNAAGFGSLDDDGTDLTFGIGAEYAFTKQFSLRGEWERFDFDDTDVDLLSIGLVVKF